MHRYERRPVSVFFFDRVAVLVRWDPDPRMLHSNIDPDVRGQLHCRLLERLHRTGLAKTLQTYCRVVQAEDRVKVEVR